jgi:hypothetical protein
MAKTNKASSPELANYPVVIDDDFGEKLHAWIDAGMNAIWINIPGDEGRIHRAIVAFAATLNDALQEEPYQVITWDPVSGFNNQEAKSAITDPLLALKVLPAAIPERSLLIMYDMDVFLNGQGTANVPVRRQFIELCKNIAMCNTTRSSPMLIISKTPMPHDDIKEYVAVVDAKLPNKPQMRNAVVDYCWQGIDVPPFDATETVRDQMAEALLGLSAEEAMRITGYSLARGFSLSSCLGYIGDEKAIAVRKIDGLTYIPHRRIAAADQLGGFDNFMQFMHECKFTYSQNAQDCGLERPRGVALIGPPGTGKTVAAMIAARVLGLDLVQLDISSMFDRWLGSSEQKMRGALEVVAAMKNCVLMVDEIDKSLGGAHKNQATDSGVSSRVLSYFLSWLSNRDMRNADDNRVFVIVTMNRTHGIPPEMLRAGRFDRLFSTLLPDKTARQQILGIHLRKRSLNPDSYDLKSIANETEQYSGGELEEIVIAARRTAYARARAEADNPTPKQVEPTTEDLLTARRSVVPIAKVDSAEVQEVIDFCKDRTVPVGLSELLDDKPRQRAIRAGHN